MCLLYIMLSISDCNTIFYVWVPFKTLKLMLQCKGTCVQISSLLSSFLNVNQEIISAHMTNSGFTTNFSANYTTNTLILIILLIL